jgi:hypothetical protein
MRKRKSGQLPRMILDRDMCIRVADGDDEVSRPTTVYHCAVCCSNPDTFSGKLRFEGSHVPVCEDHEPALPMEAARAQG